MDTQFTEEDMPYVRDGIYIFGLREGEPDEREIYHRKQYHIECGKNHLTIYKTCPACGSPKAEWICGRWAICYDCELAFDAFEWYYDLCEDENPDKEVRDE